MRRLLPHPVLAAALLALWLAMQQSAGLGHILLGGVIAIAVSFAASAVITEPVRARRPFKILKLVVVTGMDIIVSNIAVMLVLFRRRPNPASGFVEIKLELTDTFGLAILACIVTATPGSAWLEYDREHNTVLIHVFDLVDAEEWGNMIKARYETLLLEIFQ